MPLEVATVEVYLFILLFFATHIALIALRHSEECGLLHTAARACLVIKPNKLMYGVCLVIKQNELIHSAKHVAFCTLLRAPV